MGKGEARLVILGQSRRPFRNPVRWRRFSRGIEQPGRAGAEPDSWGFDQNMAYSVVGICAARTVLMVVASLVFAFGLSACKPQNNKQDTEMVVASFNGKTITLKEIDAELGESLYDNRRLAAINMAFKAILEEKAKQKGVSYNELMEMEFQARMKPPTEEEVKVLFEDSRSRLPADVTFEMVREEIEDYIKNQSGAKMAQEIRDAWLEEANFKFMLSFEPSRVAVEAMGPSMGADKAKVTIVEFLDFECLYCRQGSQTIAEVVKTYPDHVKLYFRHFPLDFHANAAKASQAAHCAHDQGKFWEYHDFLFENQDKLKVEDLKAHAKALALDSARFAECLDSERHAKTIQKDMEAGRLAGVTGTPAFFINGMLLSGALPIEKFKEVIERELQAK